MSKKIITKSSHIGLVSMLIFTLLAMGLLPTLNRTRAAFTNASLTISDSRAASTGVTYNFAFTTSVTTPIKQLDIKVCTQAGQFGDTCTAPGTFASGTPTIGTDNLAGTGRTTTAPTANAFRVVVGTPSAQSTQAVTINFTGVTNPATINTSYYVRIQTQDGSAVPIDYAQVMFAVLDTTSIAVTASVDPTFTFSVAAVNSATAIKSGSSINTSVTTTATTIPFGTLAIATPKYAAHDFTVTTNALNGYAVTVAIPTNSVTGNPPLYVTNTAGSQNIDAFSGTNASPTSWSAPAGSAASVNTGYFGYTSDDLALLTGSAARFTGDVFAGPSTTTGLVADRAGGGSSLTNRVAWAAEVNALQPAATYTGTVLLVATPTY